MITLLHLQHTDTLAVSDNRTIIFILLPVSERLQGHVFIRLFIHDISLLYIRYGATAESIGVFLCTRERGGACRGI